MRRAAVITMALLLALLATSVLTPSAQAASNYNAVLTSSGNGVAYARSSSGPRCTVDAASSPWTKDYDDGQTRIYSTTIPFTAYGSISASLFTTLDASPGWFDEAYRTLQVYQDSTLKGSWQNSDTNYWSYTWTTQSWEIGTGDMWRFVVDVRGLDYGSQTCWARGDFRVYSAEADSSPIDYYDMNGYQGSSAIYMTTGVSSADPYIVPSVRSNAEAVTDTNCIAHSTHNGVSLSVGEAVNTPSQLLNWREFYDAGGGNLQVNIPIAAAVGTDVYRCGNAYMLATRYKLSFSVANSPNSVVQIQTQYNSGINVSGPNDPGTTKDSALFDLAWDAMGFLPGMGFLVGSYSIMKDLNALAGDVESSTGLTGPGSVWETFQGCYISMVCPAPNQKVFTAQMYLQVIIPRSQFTSSPPEFTVTSLNNVGQEGYGGYPGATASIAFKAFPAVAITGTVSAYGSPAANQDIVLSTPGWGSHPSINYHIKTNQNGQYRFFGELNKAYTVSATQSTSFGPVSYSNSFTTPNDATSVINDIAFASSIAGTVKNSAGTVLPGASVAVTHPSGSRYVTTTGAQGDFSVSVNSIGTYGITASKCGYISQTKSVNVDALGALYRPPDFSLSLYSGTGDIAPITVTASGTARPGAFVTFSNCNGATVYSGTTDSAGKVPGKTGLAGGIYTVTATWTDWSACTGDPGQFKVIWMGQTTLEIPPNKNPTVVISPHHQSPCPI